jgi:hypothetical protein
MEVRIGAPSFLDAHREKRVTSLDAIEGCPPIFDSCVPFDLGRQAKVHGAGLIEEPKQMLERSEWTNITLYEIHDLSVCRFNVCKCVGEVFRGLMEKLRNIRFYSQR